MRYVKVFAGWLLGIYLSGAFVAMELNVAEWDSHGRGLALIMFAVGVCFTCAELDRQDKESEK